MEPPIFIIGCGRSGSSLLLQIINSHPDIHVGREMHLKNPWYFLYYNDFITELNKYKPFTEDENALNAIDFLFSESVEGSFWTYANSNLDIDRIKRDFIDSDRSIKSLINTYFEEILRYENVKVTGSKFPLHFHYVPLLKNWYPKSKIIHIIRDPRAVLTSELNRWNKPKHPLSKDNKFFYDISIILYVIIQWSWAIDCHFYYKEKYNDTYKLIRFEDLLLKPEKINKELFNFLNFAPPKIKSDYKIEDSSFVERGLIKGVDKSSLSRWERKLSKRKKLLFKILLKSKMSKLGYF